MEFDLQKWQKVWHEELGDLFVYEIAENTNWVQANPNDVFYCFPINSRDIIIYNVDLNFANKFQKKDLIIKGHKFRLP